MTRRSTAGSSSELALLIDPLSARTRERALVNFVADVHHDLAVRADGDASSSDLCVSSDVT